MISFMDTTFCASPDCKGECGRQWTPDLAAKAKRWWGSDDAPVAFSYFCGEPGIDEVFGVKYEVVG